MGKSRNGMKIHWSGQVGHVVGFSRRGKDYWRSLANNYNNPRTDAQMQHRAMFAFASTVVHNVGPIYKAGYRHYNTSLSQRANFFHQLYHNAVSGDITGGFSVDYTKMMVARGNLTPCHTIAASVAPATQTATISWSDNTGVGDASATDTIMYVFYNVTKQVSIYATGAATRAEETLSFTYPSDWAGDTAYLYV
ncbi:MAG: DUF6266 family protein, partial [Bacteroidales bacterium]|nr:DUF6266 family protein [Bacteroidales bacterium]